MSVSSSETTIFSIIFYQYIGVLDNSLRSLRDLGGSSLGIGTFFLVFVGSPWSLGSRDFYTNKAQG